MFSEALELSDLIVIAATPLLVAALGTYIVTYLKRLIENLAERRAFHEIGIRLLDELSLDDEEVQLVCVGLRHLTFRVKDTGRMRIVPLSRWRYCKIYR